MEPRLASRDDLLTFHSPSYLNFLKKHIHHDGDELSSHDAQQAEEFGLGMCELIIACISSVCAMYTCKSTGYDCPLFEGLYDYVRSINGSTLTAADCLVRGVAKVAINWYGGRHHGFKDEASGFCYCNDIVLSILHLLETFTKVLYIDVDIHHGDGKTFVGN